MTSLVKFLSGPKQLNIRTKAAAKMLRVLGLSWELWFKIKKRSTLLPFHQFAAENESG